MRLLDLRKIYREAAEAGDLFSVEEAGDTNKETRITAHTNKQYNDDIIDLIFDSLSALQEAEINRNRLAESCLPCNNKRN